MQHQPKKQEFLLSCLEQDQQHFTKLWKNYYEANQKDTQTIVACSMLFQAFQQIQEIDRFIQKINGETLKNDQASKIQNRLKSIRQQFLSTIRTSMDEYKHSQEMNKNKSINEIIYRITDKLELINPEQLDEDVKKLQVQLKNLIQKTLNKSLYKKLFLLMNSENLVKAYRELQKLNNQFKNQHLTNFITRMKQMLQKKQQALKKKILKAQSKKQKSRSICQQFNKVRNQNLKIINTRQRRYSPSRFQGQRPNEEYHQKLWFYANKTFQRNQQDALFDYLLLTKVLISKMAAFVADNRIMQNASIEIYFSTIKRKIVVISRFLNQLLESKSSPLVKVKKTVKDYQAVLENLVDEYENSENLTFFQKANKEINETFESFCEAVDQQFQYQVNTQVAGIRFGIIVPYIKLHYFTKSEQYSQYQNFYFPLYKNSIKKNTQLQIANPNQNYFHRYSRIIEINLISFGGSYQKGQDLLREMVSNVINICIAQSLTYFYLLFLIGGYKQKQKDPHLDYKIIHNYVRYQVNAQNRNNKKYRIKMTPYRHEDQLYKKTFIRPYFYLQFQLKRRNDCIL